MGGDGLYRVMLGLWLLVGAGVSVPGLVLRHYLSQLGGSHGGATLCVADYGAPGASGVATRSTTTRPEVRYRISRMMLPVAVFAS